MAVGFEGFGEFGEGFGDLAGDFGGVLGGIERVGIGPDEAEASADLRLVEIGQIDSVGNGIGEAFVLAAGAGELGVEIHGVADIADDEKGRAALGRGEGGDVFAGLVVGALEDLVEGGGTALAVAGFLDGLVGDEVEERAGVAGFGEGALFGLGEEAAGFVEVDEAGGGAAVGFLVGDGALEDVEVLGVFRTGGFGMRDVEDLVAELGEEEGVVGFFRTAGFFPTRNEGVDGLRRWLGHGGFRTARYGAAMAKVK